MNNNIRISNVEEVCNIALYAKTADIYMNTIDDEAIKKLVKLGYDVEVGRFISGNEEYEIKVSCDKKDKGKYINPIEEFYRLADEGRISVVEHKDGIEVSVEGEESIFYDCYEDLFYQPAYSDVKELVDKVIRKNM